ncbi:MAG TPA: HupE/UreJ family protein [Vicinamibacterales bacterium]|nr:HupE/UreJ family protein [Vicinamibacterales bacterium]
MTHPDLAARGGRWVAGLLAVMALAAIPAAHEIPVDVTAHVLIRPEGDRLRMIVRVPLAAMRDVEYPLTGAGFLDLADTRLSGRLRDAATLWIAQSLHLSAADRPLPAPTVAAHRLSMPTDRSLETWDQALAHVEGPPMPVDTQVIWNQLLFDVLLESPIDGDAGALSLRPELARLGLRVRTVLRFFLPDGAVRAFEYAGDPGLVRLDPTWAQAAGRFVALGFEHILGGIDHLLFLLCLVIPFRRLGQLVLVVTAFTVAHSITMIAAALELAPDAFWFPPLIETLIAASILYMAIENIVGATNVHRRWAIAFGFGLVHGFGFSFALRESLQFAGGHLATSLLSFNLGVELGQVLVLLAMVPVLHVVFTRVVAERMGAIVLSALVAHTAWHWMVTRGTELGEYDLVADTSFVRMLVRVAMAGVIVWGVVWAFRIARRERT